jgi:CheY-like chemotaxis protein
MKQLNVLLVEDDLMVQLVHQRMLNKLGCVVDIAATGKIALEMVNDNPEYHIIFVDIGLPDIPGFDVIKQMDQFNKRLLRYTPIIALTGYAGDEERQACLDAGVTQILHKPIVANTMRELVGQYNQ